MKKFYNYLYGKHFTLITDNRPVTQILNPKKGLPAYTAMRMQHYAVFSQDFDFDIKYRKTELHSNSDAFSRLSLCNNDENVNVKDILDIYIYIQ